MELIVSIEEILLCSMQGCKGQCRSSATRPARQDLERSTTNHGGLRTVLSRLPGRARYAGAQPQPFEIQWPRLPQSGRGMPGATLTMPSLSRLVVSHCSHTCADNLIIEVRRLHCSPSHTWGHPAERAEACPLGR